MKPTFARKYSLCCIVQALQDCALLHRQASLLSDAIRLAGRLLHLFAEILSSPSSFLLTRFIHTFSLCSRALFQAFPHFGKNKLLHVGYPVWKRKTHFCAAPNSMKQQKINFKINKFGEMSATLGKKPNFAKIEFLLILKILLNVL